MPKLFSPIVRLKMRLPFGHHRSRNSRNGFQPNTRIGCSCHDLALSCHCDAILTDAGGGHYQDGATIRQFQHYNLGPCH